MIQPKFPNTLQKKVTFAEDVPRIMLFIREESAFHVIDSWAERVDFFLSKPFSSCVDAKRLRFRNSLYA